MNYVSVPGRRDRKRQQVHEQLLIAAEQLFLERGIDHTTIDDIAEAADVARQTVFNHFPRKEALAVELAARRIHSVGDRAHALLESGVPALEVLRRTAEWVLTVAIDEGEIAVVMAQELLHHDADRAAHVARCAPLVQIFEAILEQAREEGTVRSDLPLDIVAARLSAIVRGVLVQAQSARPEVLHQEMAVCFDIIFNGITDRRQ